jgi:hypothetical protein
MVERVAGLVGRQPVRVQGLVGAPALDRGVAFMEPDAHLAGDVLLRRLDERVESDAKR